MTRTMMAANLSLMGMFVGYLNYLETFVTTVRRRLCVFPAAMVAGVFVRVSFRPRRHRSEPRSERPI